MLPGEWSEKFEIRNRPKDYTVSYKFREQAITERSVSIKFRRPWMLS